MLFTGRVKKIKCQVLYNLREITGWISGNDLHDLFLRLVDNPSPKGSQEFPEKDLERFDKKTLERLKTTTVDVLKTSYVRGSVDKWEVEKSNINIVEATQLKNRNNAIVTKKASTLMVGKNCCDAIFEDGFVILGENGEQVINAYDR